MCVVCRNGETPWYEDEAVVNLCNSDLSVMMPWRTSHQVPGYKHGFSYRVR